MPAAEVAALIVSLPQLALALVQAAVATLEHRPVVQPFRGWPIVAAAAVVAPVSMALEEWEVRGSLYWQLRYPCKLQAHLEQT
jgi:hypothetical protein